MLDSISDDAAAKTKAERKIQGIGLTAMQRGECSTSVYPGGLGFFAYQFDSSGSKLVATIALEEAYTYVRQCHVFNIEWFQLYMFYTYVT